MVAVLLAVLARRQAKPALAGTEEVALVTKAQQAGHFTQAEAVFGEVLAGEFAAGGVQQLLVRGVFGLQAALQGEKGVNALERLMGLILVMMATQMFLDGIRMWMKG